MIKNNFFRIGLSGLMITVILNVILSFATSITFTYMLAFYIVWIVFLSIGIGQILSRKQKTH